MGEPLAGVPVLVTGATGFLGSALAAALSARGARVRVLVRPTSDLARLAGLPVERVRGELSLPGSLAAAVAGQRLVFHCAALVSDWGSRAAFLATNAMGTSRLARACLEAGVARLLHVSSLSVLGLPRDGRRLDEASPLAAERGDLYSESKIAAERAALEWAGRGLPVTIVRPGAIWGAGEGKQLPRLERLLRARLLPLVDGGDNHVALSHVSNLAGGLIEAALRPRAAGELYHLTDGEMLTAREVLSGLAGALGLPPPRLSLPRRPLLALAACSEGLARALGSASAPTLTRYAVRVLASDALYPIDKARRELGYAPTVSFASGLAGLAARRRP